jgi:hypothetical protein
MTYAAANAEGTWAIAWRFTAIRSGDGIIVDTKTGETWPIEHVLPHQRSRGTTHLGQLAET